MPIALGGAYGSENQAMACRECNSHRQETPMLFWLRALRATGSAFHAQRFINAERKSFARSLGIRVK